LIYINFPINIYNYGKLVFYIFMSIKTSLNMNNI